MLLSSSRRGGDALRGGIKEEDKCEHKVNSLLTFRARPQDNQLGPATGQHTLKKNPLFTLWDSENFLSPLPFFPLVFNSPMAVLHEMMNGWMVSTSLTRTGSGESLACLPPCFAHCRG